jgi:hypothetical protein
MIYAHKVVKELQYWVRVIGDRLGADDRRFSQTVEEAIALIVTGLPAPVLHPMPTSFPYLVIARTRGVPYSWVLRFSESLDICPSISLDEDLSTWQHETVVAWSIERKRRRDAIIAEGTKR